MRIPLLSIRFNTLYKDKTISCDLRCDKDNFIKHFELNKLDNSGEFMVSVIVTGRFFGLILLIAMLVILILFMNRASKGKVERVRKLPAIEAMDDAVGRAIELGKP